jgi:hypothetical protein
MTDAEITSLLVELLVELGSEFNLKHRIPSVSGGSHALELESRSCVGTISIWAAGSADWHIFDRHTAVEALLGYAEPQSIIDLRGVVLGVLGQVRRHDDISDFRHS